MLSGNLVNEIEGMEELKMRTRIISAVVALPLLIALVILGGKALYIGILAAALLGIYEFLRAFQIQPKSFYILPMIVSVIYMGLMYAGYTELLLSSGMLLMVLFIIYIFNYTKIKLQDVFISFISFFYVTYTLGHILMIRDMENVGQYFIWLVFIIAFGSDTCAYFTGVAIGKRKLAPAISPKKSIEGSIGGALGSAIFCVVFGYFMTPQFDSLTNLYLLGFLLLGLLGSAISQIGDLAASAMKREVNIKDFGKIMPGHGGILDRFDSIIFVAPFVYYAMNFIIHFMTN